MRLPFNGNFGQSQDWNDPRFRASYARFGLLGHNGEDYALPSGTPVLAPHAGKIEEALFDASYGNYVKVQNENEASVLAHLSRIDVKVGQVVTEGQQIGLSGTTGNSTAPHLHWGYFRVKTRDRDNGFNGYIDQTDWMNVSLSLSNEETEKLRKEVNELDRQKKEWEARALASEKEGMELAAKVIIADDRVAQERNKYNGLRTRVSEFMRVCKDEFGITLVG